MLVVSAGAGDRSQCLVLISAAGDLSGAGIDTRCWRSRPALVIVSIPGADISGQCLVLVIVVSAGCRYQPLALVLISGASAGGQCLVLIPAADDLGQCRVSVLIRIPVSAAGVLAGADISSQCLVPVIVVSALADIWCR